MLTDFYARDWDDYISLPHLVTKNILNAPKPGGTRFILFGLLRVNPYMFPNISTYGNNYIYAIVKWNQQAA